MENQEILISLGIGTLEDKQQGKVDVLVTPSVLQALTELENGTFLNNCEQRGKNWTSRVKNIRINLLKKTDKSLSI